MSRQPNTNRSVEELMALDGPQFLGQAYLTLLGRPVDPEGFRHYEALVRSGNGKLQVLADLSASSEGRAVGAEVIGLSGRLAAHRPHAIPADWSVDDLLRLHELAFVESAYVAMVGSSPDEIATKHYLSRLRSGHHKIQLLSEMRRAGASNGYRPALRGLETALGRLNSGLFPVALDADELLDLNDAAFVDCAYKTLLRRSADPGGFNNYLHRLRSGRSKLGLVRDLLASAEGRAQNVVLPGLPLKLARYAKATNFWFGWLYRAATGIEADTSVERRLRAIESRLTLHLTGDAAPAAENRDAVREVDMLLRELGSTGK